MNRKYFLPVVIVSFLGIAACRLFSFAGETPTAAPPTSTAIPATPTPSTGVLEVEILYTGQWYRETFDYEADAPNIRHMALVMPVDSDIVLASPGWVFSSLQFTPSPEPFVFREEVYEYIPLLEYLYDAPKGLASIELEPGAYNLAVAFIAAPLPPPGGDVILYPGVTGGGASNEFQGVEIAAGETLRLTVVLTDQNGWGFRSRLALK
ncbi:MAG: hypothetical protein ACOYZ8_06325 [Chloroflexota bacterium]